MKPLIVNKGCLIYCRVSTKKQAQDGDSLDTQEKICRNLADSRGLNVIKVFRDSSSGRKDLRPIFSEMLNYAQQNKDKLSAIIFRNIDRLTRAGSGAYSNFKKEAQKLGIEMIDNSGMIQTTKNTLEHLNISYDWSNYSPSGVSEVIMAETASEEVRNILTRTIGQQIQLIRDGYHVGGAPDGFLLKKNYFNGKKRSILVPNPEKAKYWIEIFNLRANGKYNDQEIVDKINAMGFKTKSRNKWSENKQEIIGQRGNNPLSIKELQQEIGKTIYCGIRVHKWTDYKPIKAKFPGLVSIDTFNRANRGKIFIKELENEQYELLYNHHPEQIIKRRLGNNPLFPFKFILCPKCHKPFLGSSPSGKSGKGFPTYHCQRGHKYIGISKKTFEESIINFTKQLKFKTDFMKLVTADMVNKFKEAQISLANTSNDITINISELKQKQEHLISVFSETTNDIIRKKVENDINEIEEKIKNVENTKTEMDTNIADITRFIEKTIYLMEHPEVLINISEDANKNRGIFSLYFDDVPTYEEISNGTPKFSLILDLIHSNKTVQNFRAPILY